VRVVLDTNALVSCLLFGGVAGKLRELWRASAIVPLVSRETFDEFRRVLHYPKFGLSADEIRFLVEDECLPFFDVVEPTSEAAAVCKDPDDDKFISCAVAGKAEYLVTGDRGLLAIAEHGGVSVLSLRDFLNRIVRPAAG